MTLAKLYLPVFLLPNIYGGGVAQMVERLLSMREVLGSIPVASKKNLEAPGIDPGTSRMLSKRSTI